MSAFDPKRTFRHCNSASGSYWRNNRSNKNCKVGEPSHSPINKAVVDFAYENWRRVMLVTLPPLKIQIRPCKVAIKQWVSWKGLYRVRRRERNRLARYANHK